MNLAIIGSRNIDNINLAPYIDSDTSCIISGGARGIDTLAADYAHRHGIRLIEYLPDYTQYGRAATFIRNRKIVENADKVIAFWNGKSKGTKYTIDYAKKLNKPLTIVTV